MSIPVISKVRFRSPMTSASSESGELGRASALLASGTLVSRLLGFIKAAVLLQTIGVLAAGDAVSVADQRPNMLCEAAAGCLLSAALSPQVVRGGLRVGWCQRSI